MLTACTKKPIRAEDTILTKIYKLEVLGELRAVIVVEYRNISTIIAAMKDNMTNTLIAMVRFPLRSVPSSERLTDAQCQGFASTATREFLHLLHKVVSIEVPFVYISDHDVQGALLFTNLKYGSKSTAWASDIMTCPRLIHAGPTQAHVLAFLRSKHSDKSVPWGVRRDQIMKRITMPKTKTDTSVFDSLEKLGILELEPRLREEIIIVK